MTAADLTFESRDSGKAATLNKAGNMEFHHAMIEAQFLWVIGFATGSCRLHGADAEQPGRSA